MSELADALGKALHRPSVFRAPAFVLKAVLGEASTALLGSQRVRPERLLQRKFTFQFPEIGAALADIVSRL
jgi:NAD dependent epimerase/dehydratase family enzyme